MGNINVGQTNLIEGMCRVDEALYEELRKEYWDPKIRDLLDQTVGIERIARYYIIDAVLATQFDISLEQALTAWRKHVAAGREIHAQIRREAAMFHYPRALQAIRFGSLVLQYLLFQDTNQLVCRYAYEGFNFIVAIVESNRCLCASYTMYVQAMANNFGYSEIKTCLQPGHVFNIVQQDNVDVGWDAGYENNYKILLYVRQLGTYSTTQIENLTGWNQEFFLLANNIKPCEEVISQDSIFAILFAECKRKKRWNHVVRNFLMLQSLFPEYPHIRRIIQYFMVRAKAETVILSENPIERGSIPALQTQSQQLKTCIEQDPQLKYLESFGGTSNRHSLEVWIIRILYYLIPEYMEQLANTIGPIPSPLQWISKLFMVFQTMLHPYKSIETQLALSTFPSIRSRWVGLYHVASTTQQPLKLWEVCMYLSPWDFVSVHPHATALVPIVGVPSSIPSEVILGLPENLLFIMRKGDNSFQSRIPFYPDNPTRTAQVLLGKEIVHWAELLLERNVKEMEIFVLLHLLYWKKVDLELMHIQKTDHGILKLQFMDVVKFPPESLDELTIFTENAWLADHMGIAENSEIMYNPKAWFSQNQSNIAMQFSPQVNLTPDLILVWGNKSTVRIPTLRLLAPPVVMHY